MSEQCATCGRPAGLDMIELPEVGDLCSDCYNAQRTPEVYRRMGVYEPKLIADALGLSEGQFQALKYLLRAGHKPDHSKINDLYRAAQAIEREVSLIRLEEKRQEEQCKSRD